MGEFKKLNVKAFGKPNKKTTVDNLYWKQLGEPVLIKEFGPVDFIDFSQVEPYYFAVTSSVRVQVYSPVTRLLCKNLSRFQKTAFGGSFRRDGKLICAGGEENHVKLFDVSSKSLLRVFKGHTSSVHRCFFSINNIHIASFSDDQTVSLWDIPSEKKVTSYQGHQDYVRAGAVSPVSPDIILSGGYDNIVKVFDTRSNMVVHSVDHKAPVESVLFLPTGGIFLSAGGNEIKVWDALAGGRLLAHMINHHKTVTSLCLASNGSRIASGSLDRHVNIYDVSTFQCVHTMDYSNSILSLGISTNDDTIAVGMVDGVVSVSRRETEHRPTKTERKRVVYKYAPDTAVSKLVDIVVPENKKPVSSKHDHWLRKFEYTKALSCVLQPYITNKNPHVTVAVLQDLINRQGLVTAIGGRNTKVLVPLLRFLIKYMGDYRFTGVLIDVGNIFLDVYEDRILECDPLVIKLFQNLSLRLKDDTELTEMLISFQGALKLLISASATRELSTTQQTKLLKPSERAQGFIVNVS